MRENRVYSSERVEREVKIRMRGVTKMKEIKFKIWDINRKKFAKQITTFKFDRQGNINLIVYLDKPNKTREITDQEKYYTNEFVILQYTGLKDKNDVEIYEGDILKFTNKSFFDGEIGVVKFNHGSFRIETKNFNNLFPKDRSIKKYIEVIGNIYENKELLNERE